MRSAEDYAALLQIFYSYFGGLEQLIQDHLTVSSLPDYEKRRKANALATDIELSRGKLPPLAPQHFLPVIRSHAAALGALYVMEGSTLGGKIISQMLEKQLGLTRGLSFFKSYGDDTMQMWQRFKSALDEEENLPESEVIAAANETFLKFSEWFDINR